MQLPLVLAISICACHATSNSGTSDGGARLEPDATSNAAPECGAWRKVPVPVVSLAVVDVAAAQVGRSVRLLVDVEQCPGDLLAPTELRFDVAEYELFLKASVWRAGADCEHSDIAKRKPSVSFPRSGQWSLNESLAIAVLSQEAGACGSAPPGACERDCDCTGAERCLSGDGADIKECLVPCQYDRECGGEGICGTSQDIEDVCVVGQPECEAVDRPCMEGFECSEGTCKPTFVLTGQSRHPCACDADCDVGMRCVEAQAAGSSSFTCEALCLTTSDGWCEGAHSCIAQATVESTSDVCGWVGD